MKKILYLFSLLALLSLSSCATEKHTQTKGATPMQLPQAYGTKPNYRLKIEGGGDMIEVFLNGSKMFHDFSRSHFSTIYPVNNYVTSGENELRVRFFASKAQQLRLNPKGWFMVSLQIEDAKGKWQKLGGIVYDASAKKPTADSAHEGYYTLEAGKGFKVVALPSEAEVNKVETHEQSIRGTYKVNALNFTQKLTFPTPFPRWKFLDSEDIVGEEYFSYSIKEYEKFRQSSKMQKLYDAYEEIMGLLERKEIDKLIKLFDERSLEYAYAFRDSKEKLMQDLAQDFKDQCNDPNYELVPFERDKKYFFIEENRKIAYIPGTIKFKKKGVFFYSKYGAKFRWDGKNWILTR